MNKTIGRKYWEVDATIDVIVGEMGKEMLLMFHHQTKNTQYRKKKKQNK